MNVLLIRANRNEDDRAALAQRGLTSTIDPYLTISMVANPQGAERLLTILENNDLTWLAVTSVNAFEMWSRQVDAVRLSAALGDVERVRIAAVGSSTAQAMRPFGVTDVLVPDRFDSADLATQLRGTSPTTVVIPTGTRSMKTLPNELRVRGIHVVEETFYDTQAVNDEPPSVASIAGGAIDAVLFRSPSAAHAFASFVGTPPPHVALIAAGHTTAKHMSVAGLVATAIASNPLPETVASTIAEVLEKG